MGGDAKRRLTALRSYLETQYEIDAHVKFKQADLQASDLLNLFIDVPGNLAAKPWSDKEIADLVRLADDLITESTKQPSRDLENWRLNAGRDRKTAGSAPLPSMRAGTLLLHPITAQRFPKIVVEGAPGQGKSTLVQYVAQAHRMKFLDKDGLKRLPERHSHVPLRVPFKIDLRDLSRWIEGFDPHQQGDFRHQHAESLEGFIASDISTMSGGQDFSVSDFHEICSTTPVLIVLDGFDEVATPDLREKVLREVDRALTRLESSSPSIQAVVTTRPSAMPDSPMFDVSKWQLLQLSSIDADLALEYAARWSKARNLNEAEREEVLSVLREKVAIAHIRELARNPMQLTILLSLIHARGRSLPDQRTALYDAYVEVFFNREAEKTTLVRDNRQLLVDLHGYLAWKMHSEAEQSGDTGRIDIGKLRELIGFWLASQGYTTNKVEALFEGVVQRIVALVSRVEGTFEFEVQPLREFFAAHHLYHTAPYSPPGNPSSGTKDEILCALLDNAYWHNVLRFFAGFYSVGEIPGIVFELKSRLQAIRSPTVIADRTMSIDLLSDWVFHQRPALTQEVATAAIDSIAVRAAITNFRGQGVTLALPSECGGVTAGTVSFQQLLVVASTNYADLATRHLTEQTAIDLWLQNLGKMPDAAHCIAVAQSLGIVEQLTDDEASAFVASMSDQAQAETLLTDAGFEPKETADAEGQRLIRYFAGHQHPLPRFGSWPRLDFLLSAFSLQDKAGSQTVLSNILDLFASADDEVPNSSISKLCRTLSSHLKNEELDFQHDLGPWQGLIEALPVSVRESYLAHAIACDSAAVKSGRRGKRGLNLFDRDIPITERARHTRLRSDDVNYWIELVQYADSSELKAVWVLYCLRWASDEVLLRVGSTIKQACDELPIFWGPTLARRFGARSSRDRKITAQMLRRSALATSFLPLFLLGVGGHQVSVVEVLKRIRKGTLDAPKWAHEEILTWIVNAAPENPTRAQWHSLVREIEQFGPGTDVPNFTYDFNSRGFATTNMNPEVAMQILERAPLMPDSVFNAAIGRLGAERHDPRPIADLAKAQGWAAG